MQRHVESVVDAGLLGGQPVDRAEQAVGRGGVAAIGPGATRHVGAHHDAQLRIAVDDHPVVADAFIRLRPVRRAGGVDAGDVLDDDPLDTVGPSDDLQAGTPPACRPRTGP